MITSPKGDYLIMFTWVHITSQLLEKYFGPQNVGIHSIVAMKSKTHRDFVVKTTEMEFLSESIASDFLE